MPHFPGSRGQIHHDAWLPDGEVRSAVLLLHGYGEHIGLYEPLGRRLAADGHAVHAFDEVGHGRSDGERAVIESWDVLVEDALRLVQKITEQHPGVSLTVVGHSGGALAAYLLTARHPDLATAVVFSGAPLLPVDWVFAELEGTVPEIGDLDPTAMLSSHPDYVDALLHDPLAHQGGFRHETLRAIIAAWPEVEASLAEGGPAVPVLLVHGEQDPVVPLEVARSVASRVPAAELRTFPGDLHDVLNEHDRDDVHDVVATWLADRVTASAAA